MSFGGVNTFQQYNTTDFGLGHNGVRITLNYFDGTPEPELLNSLNSNDLRLIFKSFLKRDDTTKEKALNDLWKLLEDFKQNENLFNDDIFVICWSQLYAKLITNESKVIRIQSHQISIALIKFLGKKISKFLKDLIPLVLLGTCDTDIAVSKACMADLNDCFKGNQEKITGLWTIFEEQILNLIKEIVLVEDQDTLSDERYVAKEESMFKYNRMFTSAICLLTTTLKMNDDDMKKNKEIYKLILSEDSKLWKSLTLKTIHNLKTFESLLVLIRILFDKTFLLSHKDILKTITKKMFKSLTSFSKKNILNYATIVPQTIDTIVLLTDYKNGRIWSYDKQSKEKMLNFLSVSCTNPVPGFFKSFYNLSLKTKDLSIFDFESEWLPIWRKSVKCLNEKSFLGRFGSQLIVECWTYYILTVKKFNVEKEDTESVLQSDVLATLANGNSLSEYASLKEVWDESVSPNAIVQEIEVYLNLENDLKIKEPKHLLDNMVQLLVALPKNEKALELLSGFIFDIISQDPSKAIEVHMDIINLYRYFINNNVFPLSKQISELIYELPTWLEVESYDVFSDLVTVYTRSKLFQANNEAISSIVDFFMATFSLDITKEKVIATLNSLDSQVFKTILHDENLDIPGFIKEYLKVYDYTDNGKLFGSQMISTSNVDLLYETAISTNKMQLFCNCLQKLAAPIREQFFEVSPFIKQSFLNLPVETRTTIYKLIKQCDESNTTITNHLCNSLLEYAETNFFGDSNVFCLDYAEDLLKADPTLIKLFTPSDVESTFSRYVPYIDYRLSLVNTLKISIHLFPTDTKQMNLKTSEELICYGLFLDRLLERLPEFVDNDKILFISMISELAADYNCISSIAHDEFLSFKHTFLKLDGYNFSMEEFFQELLSPETADDSSIVRALLSNEENVVSFLYKSCILHKILLNKVDSISTSTITDIIPSIEKFVSNSIRSKTANNVSYSKLCLLMSLFEKINSSDSVTKLRTLLASECIGVRETELVSKTYKTILVLLNMLNISDIGENFAPIAPQRLNMILTSIGKWLDSDIAYDPEFSVVRLSLLKLCTSFLKFPSVKNSNPAIFDVSERLLKDSVSMCQLDDTTYILELRQYCLELFIELSKEREMLESPDDLDNDVIDLCFINFPLETNNQISMMFYRILQKSLSKLSINVIEPYYDQLMDIILQEKKQGNINQIRIAVYLLESVISERQQRAIIDYEFKGQEQNQKQLEKDLDISDDQYKEEFKLPGKLVKKLIENFPQEYLEYEKKQEFLHYLWQWHLVFIFFKDVSYNMRQLFIEQLNENDLINKMFDFISDQIDFQDTKFWKQENSDAISTYSILETSFSPYEDDMFLECKRLLGNSLYELFNNVGSLTNKWWLNIKDRSLQKKIEEFVSEFVSPILISHELTEVSSKKSRLTEKDEALTIKINDITNEVRASYLIDEQKLELSFKLPANYPLTNVQVVGGPRVGISEQKWKQWLMSTQHIITAMNGSVLDSLELFSKNVNLQFSGFEECAICYSILHAVDRKLPTKTCPTCKNKFHGACLYKWFRSSGNNTCPLCRSEIPLHR
ncbi:hypothetical protein NCAS_0C00680 [Naumovozyma castellii]|uniref:E3 ubiquitin-protein ligase listerin n=1 Tax=Naumovozyma castellii TaxID=27288 RepID=G0VC51_NAUCA|nr:hypothetical protein NCAS_0C00680 [Naumovozyma castellii CBS 4309]CCC69058.1 hypothetical protein NCAS_0C00680 [Naumovozyma castellii CBS 4309]